MVAIGSYPQSPKTVGVGLQLLSPHEEMTDGGRTEVTVEPNAVCRCSALRTQRDLVVFVTVVPTMTPPQTLEAGKVRYCPSTLMILLIYYMYFISRFPAVLEAEHRA